MINDMFNEEFEKADAIDKENGTARWSHNCKLHVAIQKALLGCSSIE